MNNNLWIVLRHESFSFYEFPPLYRWCRSLDDLFYITKKHAAWAATYALYVCLYKIINTKCKKWKLTQSVRNGNCYACNISNSNHKALCQNWYENSFSIVTRFQPDPQRLVNLFAITSDGNETTYPSFESIAICGWSSEILTDVVNKWIISVVVIFWKYIFHQYM